MRAATYPVHPDPFTIEDLYALPDDGMRHELVDGVLLVSPPPTIGHQRVTTRLTLLFGAACTRELEVMEAPGVRLSSSRVLQPDVTVAARKALSPDMRELPPSAVHLAVEVMSPSSITNDRVTEPTLYAEAGIPTYIRIELDGAETPLVHVYRLTGRSYRETARVAAGEHLNLNDPVDVSFDPVDLIES